MKSIPPHIIFLCSLACLPFLSGCIATSREITDLRDDIYQLQLKLNDMQRNQADISAKMDGLSTTMKGLNSELGDTQNRMSLLGQRMDDVESNLSQRMGKLSEQLSGSAMKVAPPPSEIYKLAYSDFSRGKYDLALVGFKSYLGKYPKGELADQAQYYIGECYYSKSEWENALEEFDAMEKNYGNSTLVPSSRLKQALCLEQLGKLDDAQKLFETILNEFPESPESFTAREKIRS